MAEYRKSVTIEEIGWVRAHVYRGVTRVQSKTCVPTFQTPASYERHFKRAHKWADDMIEVLRRQEIL